ncbi:hypothetical protein PCPL58_3971 [Pseudomonas cerasi]|nr:hypothetical protein PCPL58_3971 [Pseudomonas cerasi]
MLNQKYVAPTILLYLFLEGVCKNQVEHFLTGLEEIVYIFIMPTISIDGCYAAIKIIIQRCQLVRFKPDSDNDKAYLAWLMKGLQCLSEVDLSVLTHTNAGVTALRARMARARVAPTSFRIATLDGFTMKLISRFPGRSGHDPAIMLLTNRANDYPAIRAAALALLRARHLDQVLQSTYSRVLVDEYQDCNRVQHAIVTCLAATLPTYVMGDPMHCIGRQPARA